MRVTSKGRRAAFATLLAVACMAPDAALAAGGGSFADPLGDSTYYAPDLGTTSVAIGDDETIAVDTQVLPRQPALWGGCVPLYGVICAPANMNVTWYFDYDAGAGSLSDGGADAKVTAVPAQGQTVWEGARWDAASGGFSAGAKPAVSAEPSASETVGNARWALRLSDLGIPRPATLGVRIVSLYKSFTGLGTLVEHRDEASGSIAVPAAAPAAPSAACAKATGKVNAVQRRIRRAKRQLARGKSTAGKLRRLRAKRRRALASMKGSCAGAVAVSPPANSGATPPPGCHTVTKPVLKQEGAGIYAPWVIKPEVVVEC